VRLDDTNMVLLVKSQRDIDKRFEGITVDWQVHSEATATSMG
jgi:hypothetical protein